MVAQPLPHVPAPLKGCPGHGSAKTKGGLRLDDAKSALAGGDSGPVILPGAKAAESKLLRLVAGLDPELKMPPEGPALSAADVGKLRAWIEQGADFGTASKTSLFKCACADPFSLETGTWSRDMGSIHSCRHRILVSGA